MKKCLILIALFLCASSALAQQTQVTGTVIAPNTHHWANGTAHASLVCPGNAQAYIGHTPIARDTPTVALDGNGTLHQQLYDYAFMVDVNGAPLSCNYVYRITEQCSIANFSTNPLTGITGAGPVDLTSQINATSVNLSPQCDIGSAGGGLSIQHNGTLVGTQPIVNIIDTGTVVATVTNNPGQTRVDVSNAASGAGTGCTLPGLDTGVLSEHPGGTCYDSAHWTWNDATSKQNMQAGVGNSAGFTDSYIFGNANIATGLSTGFIAGDANNLVSTDASVFVIGNSNGSAQPLNVNDCSIIGENNRFPGFGAASTYGASIDDCSVVGQNNVLNFTNAGTSGGNPDDIYIVGSSNTLTETGTQIDAILSVHILGRENTIADTLNSVDFVTIAGDRNAVDGAQTTAQILGWHNTLHNVSTGINTAVVGADNTLTNVASSTYANVFGNNTLLSNCDACYILGQNVHNSTTNSIDIGMSTSPEIIVTPGAVNIAAWPVSKVIAFTFCPVGCTITGTPCTTGSSSYNTCDTTINFASLGSFVDANYSAQCNGVGPIDPAHGAGNFGRVTLIGIENSKSTTTLQPITATQGSTAVAWTEIDCTLTHR